MRASKITTQVHQKMIKNKFIPSPHLIYAIENINTFKCLKTIFTCV